MMKIEVHRNDFLKYQKAITIGGVCVYVYIHT